MDIERISDNFSATGQITTDDMPLIAAHGFKSIICNRPDGEDIAQPLFEVISQSAHNLNIVAVYLPIAKTGPTAEDIERFNELCKGLPRPVLAYCASGGRSKKLLGVTDPETT